MRIGDWSSDVCSSDLARLAEVDLGVDHAGQHDEPLGIERLVGRSRIERADVGNAAVGHRHVGGNHSGGREHVSARDDEIPVLAHALLPRQLSVLRSEEHTSELQSLMRISYAVFCLKKKKQNNDQTSNPPQTAK